MTWVTSFRRVVDKNHRKNKAFLYSLGKLFTQDKDDGLFPALMNKFEKLALKLSSILQIPSSSLVIGLHT